MIHFVKSSVETGACFPDASVSIAFRAKNGIYYIGGITRKIKGLDFNIGVSMVKEGPKTGVYRLSNGVCCAYSCPDVRAEKILSG